MANEILKQVLHPENEPEKDIYPKTSSDQVDGLEQAIIDLGFQKVVGNPEDDESETLTKIKIGDTIFAIPSGGGSLYIHRLIIGNGQTSPLMKEQAELIILNTSSTLISDYATLYANRGNIVGNNGVAYGGQSNVISNYEFILGDYGIKFLYISGGTVTIKDMQSDVPKNSLVFSDTLIEL